MPTLLSTLFALAVILLTVESAILLTMYVKGRNHTPGKRSASTAPATGRHVRTAMSTQEAPPPAAPPVLYPIRDLSTRPRYARNGQWAHEVPATLGGHTASQGVDRERELSAAS